MFGSMGDKRNKTVSLSPQGIHSLNMGIRLAPKAVARISGRILKRGMGGPEERQHSTEL